MNERVSVALLAVLGAAAAILAPWAVINREIGARSTVLLLPNRVFDFTGRTEPVIPAGLELVLILVLLAFAALFASAWTTGRRRYFTWIVAGLVLLAATTWSVDVFDQAVDEARVAAVVTEVENAIENPRGNRDIEALEEVVALAGERSLDETVAAAGDAGLRIRRLPYAGTGMSLGAFLAIAIGLVAIFFGLRVIPGASRLIDRTLASTAVPAISILFALLASGVVVLLLQETPTGSDVVMSGPMMGLAGRLDTLWHAYYTLFADSLGTLSGFFEALKFATPLIFTGLSVAFGFRAGLFNIGAPGQMILGALGAAAVGVYLPGPLWLVMPLAIISAAVFGGLWGALPGWLKARFGANEVINTILLNYIASSILLFLLSDRPTFAAPVMSILRLLAVVVPLIVVLMLIPPLRRFLGRAPRLSFAISGVVLLIGMVAVAVPVANDPPIIVDMPFKEPGYEPKSHPLQPTARIPQVPALFGIDLMETPGVNVVSFDLAAWLAPLLGVLAVWLVPRRRVRRLLFRVLLGLVVWGVGYGLLVLLGLGEVPVAIPPTELNLSFILALLAAIFMQIFMWRTKWGYDLRAVGAAPKAAEYGGANIGANVILAMTVAGAFAGLTATHYVLGGALADYSLRQALPTNDGFDGIAVALLGGNTPLGVVLSAFLFGVLKNGGAVLNITFAGLTRDVVSMILALVVLFIAARGFLPERFSNPLKRRDVQEVAMEPELREHLDAPGRPLRTEEE